MSNVNDKMGNRKGNSNAVKHGAYSQRAVLLPWEDKNAFDELHQGLRNDYPPTNRVMEQLVWQLAIEFWQLQRIDVAEFLHSVPKQAPSELIEAGKKGPEALADYIVDPAHASDWVSTADVYSRIRKHIEEHKFDEDSEKSKPTIPGVGDGWADRLLQAYDVEMGEKFDKRRSEKLGRIQKLLGMIRQEQEQERIREERKPKLLPAPPPQG